MEDKYNRRHYHSFQVCRSSYFVVSSLYNHSIYPLLGDHLPTSHLLQAPNRMNRVECTSNQTVPKPAFTDREKKKWGTERRRS